MATVQTGIATDLITFSRTSNATLTDSDGKIKWAPHNLLLASEQFDAASWTKAASCTISANNAVAPNGTTTADTVTLGAGTAAKVLYQTIASTAAQCVIGVYVKIASGTVRYIQLLQNIDVQSYANFDITGNAVGTKGTNTLSSAITNVGSDWYYITATFTGAGSAAWVQVVDGTSSAYSSATSATGTFHLWGAHLYRSDLGGMKANTSAYPMYNPTTPKNLIGFTQDFSNAAWVAGNSLGGANGIKTPNFGIAPDGTQTATRIQLDVSAASVGGQSQIYQSYTAVINTPYTLSAWVKTNDGSTKTIMGFRIPGGTPATLTVTGEWTRLSSVKVPTGTAEFFQLLLVKGTTSDTADLLVWRPQASDSASLDTYAPNYGAAPTAAAYYGPRLDYDPVTLAAKGLLVEEQRTNLMTYSADISQWTVQAGVTVTVNQAVAPDGTMTADLIVGNGTAGVISPAAAVSGASNNTKSIWLRAVTGTTSVILKDANTTVGTVTCNLTTSWQRFSLSETQSAGLAGIWIDDVASSGIYAWGGQIEQGSFATSYIPTGATTAGATRNADVASVSTQAFPYSSTEGTLVANGSPLASVANTTNVIAELGDGGATNLFEMYRVSGTTNGALYVASGGVGSTITISNAFPANAASKFGGVYKVNDFQAAANGTLGTPVTSGAVPTAASNLYIGKYGGGTTTQWNGHIRQITYLPRRVTNAELQTRTA
jgi:hypothetical protein